VVLDLNTKEFAFGIADAYAVISCLKIIRAEPKSVTIESIGLKRRDSGIIILRFGPNRFSLAIYDGNFQICAIVGFVVPEVKAIVNINNLLALRG
jgi:hypothetical protein